MYLSKFLSRTGTNADHGLKPVRFLCALVIVILSISMTGCSRGYISSYSDHVRRSSFSPTAMTAVSAEFSGKADLYAEDLAVPGEGKAVDVGSLKASGLFTWKAERRWSTMTSQKRFIPPVSPRS